MVAPFGDVDDAVRTHSDVVGLNELARAGSRAPPRPDEPATAVELVDAIIADVGDVKVARRVEPHAGRKQSRRSPGGDEPAHARELLDPSVDGVADVDHAARGRGDAMWQR